jgi:hypothetical protein
MNETQKSVEHEYQKSQKLCYIHEEITNSLSKKQIYLFNEIWEKFLISITHFSALEATDHSYLVFLSDLENKKIKLTVDVIQLLKADVLDGSPQILVDTHNTFIYKKFKKVLNNDVYEKLLKFTDRLTILLMLLRYNNIYARKFHTMLTPETLHIFINPNEDFLDGYSSPFSRLSDQYFSLFPDDVNTLGNVLQCKFDFFMDKILVLHPPQIDLFITQCIDFTYNLLSFIKHQKKSIKIILAIKKDKVGNLTRHESFTRKTVTSFYNYYDYNGILKTVCNDPVVVMEFTVG